MLEGTIGVIVFLQQYVIPVVFALGVIFFLYGFINSFLVGRPDIGQPHLIRSIFLFGIALVVYGALACLGLMLSSGGSEVEMGDTEFGGRVDRDRSVLPVPNVPSGND